MTKAVQMKLEGTILLPSGSNAQRVQVYQKSMHFFILIRAMQMAFEHKAFGPTII